MTKGIVVILAGLLVIGLAIYFFTGPGPFTQTIDDLTSFNEWTPENIAEYPEKYLNFCEKNAKAIIGKLKASEIANNQAKLKVFSTKSKADEKIRVGKKHLGELKLLYKKAEAANSWPLKFNGQDRTRAWARRNVVSLDKEVKLQERLSARCQAAANSCGRNLDSIRKNRAEAQSQLSEVAVLRQELAVSKITGDLEAQLVNMKSTMISLATSTSSLDPEADISLDGLARQAESDVSDEEFDSIMGK